MDSLCDIWIRSEVKWVRGSRERDWPFHQPALAERWR